MKIFAKLGLAFTLVVMYVVLAVWVGCHLTTLSRKE